MRNSALYIHAESLQNMMVACATGKEVADMDYVQAREGLMEDASVEHLLPGFIRTCRTSDQFWAYIKRQSDKYEGRRQHIWTAFQPLLLHLERGGGAPQDHLVEGVLGAFDAEHVSAAWLKALARRATDPEGAITSARSLVEAVCKHILDESGGTYDDKDDLPKLYRKTAERLNIAPSQHTEEVFRQILGGCTAIVEGLGTLRNRLSDAHGKGKAGVRPAPRHAEFAVNLSGAVAMFLLATWDAREPLR